MKKKRRSIKRILLSFMIICLTLNVVPMNLAYGASLPPESPPMLNPTESEETPNVLSMSSATGASLSEYPPVLYPFSPTESQEILKSKIINSQEFIFKHALLAHYLGFGWCGGTASPYVGNDFEFRKEGDNYVLQARYNSSDPHAGGYWADKRLKMTVSNVKFYFAPETVKQGEEKITELEPLAAQTFKIVNRGDTEDTANTKIAYTASKSVSKSSNYKFGQSLGTKTTVGVNVLFFKGEKEISYNFNAEQSWSDTTTTVESTNLEASYTGKIPPKSKRIIKLMSYRTKSDIPYTANIYMDYDITFSGFLRWGGNARTDHPKNRPFVDVTFGNGDLTAQEEIEDMYNHRSIPGYSQWDWNWMDQQFGANNVNWVVSNICNRPMGATMTGKFTCVDGSRVEVVAGEAIPLTPEELTGAARAASGGPIRGATIEDVHLNYIPEVNVDKTTVETGAGTTEF
ncbi:aerolysin family beta-barrel pore-forming toxin [Wukongibacter baidiensis]|uniref:aerolysin family beta-barrel pore-forming toxin n=1 Tax=Wukongibacter baidiensis TaxID=1723361 RepID=UPI003D7F2F59